MRTYSRDKDGNYSFYNLDDLPTSFKVVDDGSSLKVVTIPSDGTSYPLTVSEFEDMKSLYEYIGEEIN